MGGNALYGRPLQVCTQAFAALDDAGAICLCKSDRDRPAPSRELWRSGELMMRAFEGRCYRQLVDFWQQYPAMMSLVPVEMKKIDRLKLLRGRVGETFSYEWLMTHLALFGVTEDLRGGKGSHGKLLPPLERQGRTYTTSRNFREAERLHFRHLPKILTQFGIGLEEFFRSLE